MLISAEAYIKKVDGITTRSQGFQNQFQFANDIGSYEIKGIDLLLNKQFNSVISTWIGYSINKNNYTFNTINEGKSFRNNIDIRHALTFAGTYTYNDLKLALGLNWHSGKPTTLPDVNDDPEDDFITYSNPNSGNLEDYLRADCSATYTFRLSDATHAVFGASVWNVFNQKNIVNTYHILDRDNDNSISKVENQSLGITPNISLRLQF